MAFLPEFDRLDDRSGNALLYRWIKYRREELFEELRVRRPSLRFWSHHPGNPDLPAERGPGAASLITRRADVRHALANYSMRPYVLANRFLLSEDDAGVHARLRKALSDSLEVEDHDGMLDAAIGSAWRIHLPAGREPTERRSLDVRQFGRDTALAFARRFFGLPEDRDAPDRLAHWSERGYERFIWKLHARHFVPDAPDPRNEALAEIGTLVGHHWQNPVPGSMIDRLKAHVDAQRGLTEARLIANVIGSLQGMVDNAMTGACYALNALVLGGKMDTVRLLARDGRLDVIRSMLHEAHRTDTPSPFLPRRLLAADGTDADADADADASMAEPGSDAHIVCAIGAALGDPAAETDSDPDGWDLRLGHGRHACAGKRIGDDLMVRIVVAVARLEGIEVEEPLQKRWGWIVSSFSVSGLVTGDAVDAAGSRSASASTDPASRTAPGTAGKAS